MLRARRIDVVLDVGAARGGFGRELRDFGYEGRIVSFEPLGDAHRDLSELTATDPGWTAVRTAIGAEQGTATINVASNSTSSSLLPMGAAHLDAAPEVNYVGTEEVTMSRLDDVAPAHLHEASRTFLKVDTQGFERSVLEGAPETLARCEGLQLELSLTSLYDGGMVVDEAIAMAYARGFELTALFQGFTSPDGRLLQVDGVFFRNPADGASR